CKYCGVSLLTGERHGGFCCGPNGKFADAITPLPELPVEFEWLTRQNNVSSLSRILNLLFSFASLETTHAFPKFQGQQGFFAIQGRVYHR
ncbi:hypothetical protein M422DRAFT_142381, partial [Sphaerobolus stellatus SS14]